MKAIFIHDDTWELIGHIRAANPKKYKRNGDVISEWQPNILFPKPIIIEIKEKENKEEYPPVAR